MIKIIKLTLLFICASVFVTEAQINYVQNGSFEQYSQCPNSVDEVRYALHWNGLDTGWVPGSGVIPPACFPDYENACSIWGSCTIPDNSFFFQYARTGRAMIQNTMYYNYGESGIPNARDYLQGPLSHVLFAGQSYCVTFYVNMANRSAYAVNHISAYFDDGTIDTTTHCDEPQTQYTPQILEEEIINDTLNWIKVQGSFIANGTERYITIGNFFDTAHTTHIQLSTAYFGWYLIDDVSVIPSNAVADAGPDVSITGGDTATIGVTVNGDGMPCYWYVSGSTTPIDSGGTIKVHPLINTTYVVSMDLCGTVTYDTVNVTVHPTGINTQSVTDVRVYPNPAHNEITVSGTICQCPYRLLTMLGTCAREGVWHQSSNTLSLSGLSSGLYMLQLTDADGVRKIFKLEKE